MVHKNHFIVGIVVLMLVFPFSSRSQEDDGILILKGLVEEAYQPLQNAKIIVHKDSRKIDSFITKRRGVFNLELDLHDNYIIDFSKEGYVTKKIAVNTSLTEHGGKIWRVEFSIGLFKMYPGLDVSALRDPVTKIVYKEEEESFGYDESYTNMMMARVDKIYAKARELRENAYRKKIMKADHHFQRQEYPKAIQYYQSALDQRPEEEYPKEQIGSAKKLYKEYKEHQALYKRTIDKADSFFDNEKYEHALDAYKEALVYDSSSMYPVSRIGKIEQILSQQQADKQLSGKDARYEEYIEMADQLFEDEYYKPARRSYSNALEIFPGKQYPSNKIDEINQILARIDQKKANVNKYWNLIDEADEYFTAREFTSARASYSEAMEIMPDQEYPRNRISMIDGILARMDSVDDQYRSAIQEGDAYFQKGIYWLARNAYQNALEIKPEKEHPRKRIIMTNGIIQFKYQQLRYESLISEADGMFEQGSYMESKEKYREALDFKPWAEYPQKRLRTIKGIIREDGFPQRELVENRDEPVEAEKAPPKLDFADENEEKSYLRSLEKRYPKGITVENYRMERRRIKRIVVNSENVTADYRKIEHEWGGTFYFRNGQTISREVFNIETKPYDQ